MYFIRSWSDSSIEMFSERTVAESSCQRKLASVWGLRQTDLRTQPQEQVEVHGELHALVKAARLHHGAKRMRQPGCGTRFGPQ